MICQRSGACCVTMDVIIPVKEDGEWRAKMKPGGMQCPHMTYEGTEASCAVHEEEIFQGSPCWIYGNSYVDPDFIPRRGKPCPVGKMYQENGGFVQLRTDIFNEEKMKEIREKGMRDLGPFTQERGVVEFAEEVKALLRKGA